MPKICKSCGKEYTGEFCEHCGYGNPNLEIKAAKKYETKIPERFLPPEEQERLAKERLAQGKKPKTITTKQKRNQKILLLILVIALAGIIFFVLYNQGMFSSNDPNELVNQYFTSISEMDYDKYNACFSSDLAKENNKGIKSQGLDKDTAMETLYSDYINVFGKGFKSTVKIDETLDMDKGDVIEQEMDYQEQYGKSVSLEEGKIVKTTVKFEGSKSSEDVKFEVYVARIGAKWCILNVKETDDVQSTSQISDLTNAG